MEYLFFPLYFDSTMLAELSTCQLSFFRKYVQHLVPVNAKSESIHLVAGGAFARASEVARKVHFEQGVSENMALISGLRVIEETYTESSIPAEYFAHKNETAVKAAFVKYLRTFPLDTLAPVQTESGNSATEFHMEVDLPINHPQLGIPIKFVGRADVIAERNNRLYCGDEKTCSSFPANWESSWDLRGQFSAYSWLLRQYGYDVAGAIVRGVKLPKSLEKLPEKCRQMSFLIGDTLEEFAEGVLDLKETDTIECRETVSPRNSHQVNLWERSMLNHLRKFLEALAEYEKLQTISVFSGNFNEGCIKYTMQCPFASACTHNQEDFLDSMFKQEIWLPHEARRVPLEEYLYANDFI